VLWDTGTVKAQSREIFADLLSEVETLTDADLNDLTSLSSALDPAWLDGRPLWELIAIDAFEHYPMHYDALDGARAQSEGTG